MTYVAPALGLGRSGIPSGGRVDNVMSQLGKTIVMKYFTMWNTGDTTRAGEVLADDYVDHVSNRVTGPGTMVDAISKSRALDPDLHVFVDAVMGDGSMVTVVGRTMNKQEGLVEGRTWTFRVADKITEIWEY